MLELDTIRGVSLGTLLDRLKGMHDRGVVAPAQRCPDRFQRERGVALADGPHRRLARLLERKYLIEDRLAARGGLEDGVVVDPVGRALLDAALARRPRYVVVDDHGDADAGDLVERHPLPGCSG